MKKFPVKNGKIRYVGVAGVIVKEGFYEYAILAPNAAILYEVVGARLRTFYKARCIKAKLVKVK